MVETGANGAPMTLRSVGLAYRALSVRLADIWAPWYRAETMADWNALPPSGPPWASVDHPGVSGLSDALDALATLESLARRVLGARGCVNGSAGCPPEWVRDCDVCTEKKHV